MSEKMFNSYDDKSSPGADDLFLLWDNQESKVKNLKINNLSKYVENKFQKILPNPQALTITYGGKTHTYDGSEAIAITIETGGIERIEKLATDTTVTLEPNKLYIFPEMASLTYTLAEPADASVANEYHFVFKSCSTATELVHPSTVNIGSFTVESNRVYEVSILEGLLTSQNWSVN
jgi:hypothetical protein